MSPLAQFVNLITCMAEQRLSIVGMLPTGGADFATTLEDLAMMTTENMVIGMRSQWVRRVALPIYKAQQALTSQRGSKADQANTALEILRQCTDVVLREKCAAWICEQYGVTNVA